MSTPSKPDAAKLVIGVFTNSSSLFAPIAEKITEKYGSADIISEWMPFDYTTYYEPEMGRGLMRRMISFDRLIEQDDLVDIKLFTNSIEKEFATDGNRMVNIDPGYLLMSRFILATGKDFTHRVYLKQGIYADLTLIFKKGTFQTLPWTYPDYADSIMFLFLKGVRNKYINDIKTARQNFTEKIK